MISCMIEGSICYSFFFCAVKTFLFMKGSDFIMQTYTISEVAKKLNVNNETVRRWVRSGKIQSTITSKKIGHVIYEQDLYEFMRSQPKYNRMMDIMTVPQVDSTCHQKLNELLTTLIEERDRLDREIGIIQQLLSED